MMHPGIFRRWSDAASLLLAGLLSFGAQAQGKPSLSEALTQAQSRHTRVLVDFRAPWCYSCYYMARNVLTGSDWEAVEKRAVVLEVDVDSPEGAELKQRLAVKALPSYVVLDERGRELGRILAEQTRSDFYSQLDTLLGARDPIDAVRDKVKEGGAVAVRAAIATLQAYHLREDARSGLAWWNGLDAKTRDTLTTNDTVKLWTRRLELLDAADAKDAPRCAAAADKVFDGDLGCDRYYEVDRALECTADLPQDQRKKLFGPQKKAMDRLLEKSVFVDHPSCADARSAVLASADLDHAIENTAAEAAVLDKAIKDVQQRLGGPKSLDLTKDRNLADNLRVFLDRAGRTEALDQLYPKLIAAYPDDYVYPYRFGRSLAARGRDEDALPYLEQAADRAYGVNRLNVAQLRAEVLLRLNRPDDARAMVAETLRANGPWFPQQAARLKALVASL